MKKHNIDGLLLCSVCENQLKVDVYEGGNDFFKVYPCIHCTSQPENEVAMRKEHSQ
jgi:hypothetical protein